MDCQGSAMGAFQFFTWFKKIDADDVGFGGVGFSPDRNRSSGYSRPGNWEILKCTICNPKSVFRNPLLTFAHHFK
jgi:hypothetical protein